MSDPDLLCSTKAVLKYLIKKGSGVLTVNSICIDFYNYTKVHIPLFELGFSNLVTFLQSIPDVVQVDPVTLQIRPATFHESVSIPSPIMHPSITFPRVLRFDRTSSNNEIRCELGRQLDLNDTSGLLNKSMSTSSSDVIGVKFDDSAGKPCDYDYDYNRSSPEEKGPTSSDDDAVPLTFDDKINMLSSCFFNGNFCSSFITTNINDIMTIGSIYEIRVSEVNSPYKFWFQLDEEIPNSVQELQRHLNECYNMTDCPELIKPEYVKKGYPCATLYAKVWHRGEIIEKLEDGKVSIFFVDYGTVDLVDIGDVRYLSNSFSWPKLCHRGTLDFIKPTNASHRWSIDASLSLISLVKNRKLIAGITEVDRKNNSVRMYLIDSAANININCSLVYEGFAYPHDPRDRYHHHIADDPSFESLETGHESSSQAIITPLDHNYDYDKSDGYIPTHVEEEVDTSARVEEFMSKKEGRKHTKQRDVESDGKVFLEIFKNILKNPFLNGNLTGQVAIDATNPFSD